MTKTNQFFSQITSVTSAVSRNIMLKPIQQQKSDNADLDGKVVC